MADKKIAVGILGLGRSGWGIHARTIRNPAVSEKFQVVAVTDPITARMEEAKEVFGLPHLWQRGRAGPGQGSGAGGSCHLQPPARRAQHRCHARRQGRPLREAHGQQAGGCRSRYPGPQ